MGGWGRDGLDVLVNEVRNIMLLDAACRCRAVPGLDVARSAVLYVSQ